MLRNAAMLLGTFLLLAGLGLPKASGDPQDDAFTKELKAMAGTWRPISTENNGNKAPEESLKETRWIRDADGRWAMQRGDKAVLEWTVRKIDATKKPKTIDIEVTAGPHKGVVYRGIYELDGDTLRVCLAQPESAERPTEFSARKGSTWALSEFKREKI
jgi:uncharacterized protein (TIGR03067 family)